MIGPHGLFDVPWSIWKFSSVISHIIQHPTVVPHLWLFSHSTNIFPLWYLLLNQALKHCYVIIQSHMSSKLLILMRIMSPFEETLSFPLFMIHMIIKMSIIPTNLPHSFHSLHYITILLINPLPFQWLNASLHMAISAQPFQDASFQITRKHFWWVI